MLWGQTAGESPGNQSPVAHGGKRRFAMTQWINQSKSIFLTESSQISLVIFSDLCTNYFSKNCLCPFTLYDSFGKLWIGIAFMVISVGVVWSNILFLHPFLNQKSQTGVEMTNTLYVSFSVIRPFVSYPQLRWHSSTGLMQRKMDPSLWQLVSPSWALSTWPVSSPLWQRSL